LAFKAVDKMDVAGLEWLSFQALTSGKLNERRNIKVYFWA